MNGVAIGPNSQKNIDAAEKSRLACGREIYPEETVSSGSLLDYS